jgi:hypothetical protein
MDDQTYIRLSGSFSIVVLTSVRTLGNNGFRELGSADKLARIVFNRFELTSLSQWFINKPSNYYRQLVGNGIFLILGVFLISTG